jgi:hypothetical protein
MNIWLAFALSFGFLAVAVYLRYLLAKAAWSYHTDGAKGYLKDILLETIVSYAPMLAIIFSVRLYIEFNPQDAGSPLVMGSIAVAVVSMLLAKRLPFVKAASQRMMKARSDRWEAAAKQ